jgi:hypothetical protein
MLLWRFSSAPASPNRPRACISHVGEHDAGPRLRREGNLNTVVGDGLSSGNPSKRPEWLGLSFPSVITRREVALRYGFPLSTRRERTDHQCARSAH